MGEGEELCFGWTSKDKQPTLARLVSLETEKGPEACEPQFWSVSQNSEIST